MTTDSATPVLYSFRRCPYAMRARLALAQAGVAVHLREILLKNKPAEMLAISPKGTVPVLQLPDGQVIDESIDVMRWALQGHHPDSWLEPDPELTEVLIEANDGHFKTALDRYKYFTRFPEQPRETYREQGETFFRTLEEHLNRHDGKGLTRDSMALADAAIFPFVRQFVNADPKWFETAPYPLLRAWLNQHLSSPLFNRVMQKYPLWEPEQPALLVDWQ